MQWYRLSDQNWEESDGEESGAIQLELSWSHDPPGYQRCLFRKAKQNAKGKKKEKKDPRAGRRKKVPDRPPQKGETPAERRERMAEFNEIQELEMAVMNDGVVEGDYQIQVRSLLSLPPSSHSLHAPPPFPTHHRPSTLRKIHALIGLHTLIHSYTHTLIHSYTHTLIHS
jgi:hypothetical protein